MNNKKNTGLSIFLVIVLIIQCFFMSATLAYAFFGTYSSGYAADFLSVLWSMGLALFQLAFNLVAIITGIIGLVKQKGNVIVLIVSILLIISFFFSPFTLLIAIGKQF
ncbi:MAG: hypothetical protein K6C99_05595 [Lachnospiraceae bacterium]|nr:hypothetical protein [Lachnospiraceae bacterium]